MLTRRVFLAAAGSLSLRAKVETTATISRQPEFYHGWPTLAQRRNGDLLAVWSGGREAHVCPFGRVEMMRSHDGGRTWSWPEVLLDTVIDDRDAGLCETPRGTILVTTFTSLAYQAQLDKSRDWDEDRRARWQAVNRRTAEAQRTQMLGTWMLRSIDGGLTWSAPYRVPMNSPHGPSALKNGRLIYAGKKLWDPGTKVGLAESTDDGQTWQWVSDIPARPGDRVEDYHELHQVEAPDGRIVVHIRNHNQANAGEILQCESGDGGRTWTEPRAIGVWGLPSHLLPMRDGRLLMSYGYRRAPFGNQARVSDDGGRTWSQPLTISADGASSDLGYPSTVERPDGSLLTLWYERPPTSPKAVLRQAAWRLS